MPIENKRDTEGWFGDWHAEWRKEAKKGGSLLETGEWREGRWELWSGRFREDRRLWFIWEEDEERESAVAVASYRLVERGGVLVCKVSITAVDEDWQGRGVGSALYRILLERGGGVAIMSDSSLSRSALRLWRSLLGRREWLGFIWDESAAPAGFIETEEFGGEALRSRAIRFVLSKEDLVRDWTEKEKQELEA